MNSIMGTRLDEIATNDRAISFVDKSLSDKTIEARKDLVEFKKGLLNNNRYFCDSFFERTLNQVIDASVIEMLPNKELYRARIYNEEDKPLLLAGCTIGNQFEGYDKKGSFVNEDIDWPSYGRMNPNGIRCLYVSSDERTCIKEVLPASRELISVATILVKQTLKIADLSKNKSCLKDPYCKGFSIALQEMISEGYSEKDYVLPQYIAAFCQSLGYDGIGYRSKYATQDEVKKGIGVNYTIFNYNKCEVINSRLHLIKNMILQETTLDRIDNL